jgi:hypothetical protein
VVTRASPYASQRAADFELASYQVSGPRARHPPLCPGPMRIVRKRALSELQPWVFDRDLATSENSLKLKFARPRTGPVR